MPVFDLEKILKHESRVIYTNNQLQNNHIYNTFGLYYIKWICIVNWIRIFCNSLFVYTTLLSYFNMVSKLVWVYLPHKRAQEYGERWVECCVCVRHFRLNFLFVWNCFVGELLLAYIRAWWGVCCDIDLHEGSCVD